MAQATVPRPNKPFIEWPFLVIPGYSLLFLAACRPAPGDSRHNMYKSLLHIVMRIIIISLSSGIGKKKLLNISA
jgi:hypothetical protein